MCAFGREGGRSARAVKVSDDWKTSNNIDHFLIIVYDRKTILL